MASINGFVDAKNWEQRSQRSQPNDRRYLFQKATELIIGSRFRS
ncbi:hypothetical protein [Candidatus Brocadia sapporoensis]|nr:hypothetical protein [Candidatus Brocadia sapporoensis]